MKPATKWWYRAAASIKDRRSLCLSRVAQGCSYGGAIHPDLESAVIRATSHDERASDIKSAGRVLAWARSDRAVIEPLMWALGRRIGRTRSWAVALKGLMLTHGLLLLLRSSRTPPLGRLPFDLSDFKDGSVGSWGISVFVRAYFRFLDRRSMLLAAPVDELDRIEQTQELLDLLMQVRPSEDGMEMGIVLEAMDCVVLESFQIYSCICNGIAKFLVGILGSSTTQSKEERRRRGMVGIRALKKAREQSARLTSYFQMCQTLEVLKSTEFPDVESVPMSDIDDLERLIMELNCADEERRVEPKLGDSIEGIVGCSNNITARMMDHKDLKQEHYKPNAKDKDNKPMTVVSQQWVVFNDETVVAEEHKGNPFVGDLPASWKMNVMAREPLVTRPAGILEDERNGSWANCYKEI